MNSVMPQTHHTAKKEAFSDLKAFLRVIPNYLVIYLATLIDILEPFEYKINKEKGKNQ
tara:strand:+ start:1885 stop:2058 length:174 start_codon:yes stop_codon:yes gene_type:complete